jgi:hypothetical protein
MFLKEQIIAWFGCDGERIEIIGNGVEGEYFDVANQPMGLSGRSVDRPYLLCVGGLNDIDGGRLILQVAQVLSRVDLKPGYWLRDGNTNKSMLP